MKCADDPVYWINHWAWTYDPRESLISTMPFDLFPRQAEYIRWIQEREQKQESGLCEKSREMGITWASTAYATHGWLFRPGFSCGFGSRKLDYADKIGDPDSILEKVRIILDNLPLWMMPAKYNREKHANYCKIFNVENGNTITGEGGADIGRGGRKSIYFVDEAAFLENPMSVERSLSQTTRVRIDLSTVNGVGGPFYEKRFSGKTSVFIFDWRDDPRKNDAWLAEQYRKFDAATVAQEVLRDYSATVEGVCIPGVWVNAAVDLDLPATGPTIAGFDISDSGQDLNVLSVRRGPKVMKVIHWPGENTTETAWRARDEGNSLMVSEVYFDCVGVGAGVKGTWATSPEPLRFRAVAVNTGESPTDTRWPDGRTSKEKFKNLKAEGWWLLRTRFEKAYEFKVKGIKHPPEEMISIPNVPQLISELSTPKRFFNEAGKIQIESKDAMARRGIKSPDFADALVLSFTPQTKGTEISKESIGMPATSRGNVVASAPLGVFGRQRF